jgi:transcriptional antiterminator RfaH
MEFWACARVEPRREAVAQHFLRLAGFFSYVPLVRSERARRGRKVEKIEPLFPSYAFILIHDGRWWDARWAVGVAALIMAGDGPAQVPDRVIDDIRQRERDGVVVLPEPRGLRAGDPVRITQGPFTGHLALYAGMASHARVLVLLSLLGSQQKAILPKSDIEPVRA